MKVTYQYIYQIRDRNNRVATGFADGREARAIAKRIGGTCKRLLVECAMMGDIVIYPDWYYLPIPR